jgi:hypothetical protein
MGLPIENLPDTINALCIQYHFDNSDGDENKFDNGTGIKIYYTNESVDDEFGMIAFADGRRAIFGQPLGNGKSKVQT